MLYIFKLTGRSIRSFLGRYMALLLIVALSVGFYAGLRVTKDAMWDTAEDFLSEQSFYDFEMLSTLGFTQEDVERFGQLEFVSQVEGGKSQDLLMAYGDEVHPYKLIALPEAVNKISLAAGRMPERPNECLADKNRYTEADIGGKVVVSESNSKEDGDNIAQKEYTIVGLADSPLYLGMERGSTSIGGGALNGFFYLPQENFTSDIYTEVYLTLQESAGIYSQRYDQLIDQYKQQITDHTKELASNRYDTLWDELLDELEAEVTKQVTEEATEQITKEVTERLTDEVTSQLVEEITAQMMQQGLPESMARPMAEETAAEQVPDIVAELVPETVAELLPDAVAEAVPDIVEEKAPEAAEEAGLKKPDTYVLTRKENAGYRSFESDTSIVSGISNILPVFFILIALLVCVTTMTRMVDEERTQIGTLKAMGLKNSAITAKYLLYAGSATVIGWAFGFFLGTWGLPEVFWFAYNSIYDFTDLNYIFSVSLALGTLGVSLAGILGSAWLSCRRELSDVPARLIRPKGAKMGRRIFLERLTPLWSRLPFLTKVTVRNLFRYKKRLIMMLFGIGCCAGLVVTAFGVGDSMLPISGWQFERIQTYQLEATFSSGEKKISEELEALDGVESHLLCLNERVDLHSGENTVNTVGLHSFSDWTALDGYWSFLDEHRQPLAFPQEGEALVSTQLAEKLKLSPGDTVEVENSDQQRMTVTVSGVFENYLDHYLILSEQTYSKGFEKDWKPNAALIISHEPGQTMAERLIELQGVSGVTQLSATRERVEDAMSCLNYIITLVVFFAGALAFIVIFNLTNINLAERSREIATVQVLGFYPRETESYVLYENLALSVLAAGIGLPLGTLFHRIVMSMIQVNAFMFGRNISGKSYLLAFLCTVLFAVVVNLFMKRQIGKIKMAESLKAVE